MDLPDKGAACPLIKLVYIDADGELRRVGPRFLLKHYYSSYNSFIINVKGYSVRGNNQTIDMELQLKFDDNQNEMSLHNLLLKKLGYNIDGII